MARRLAKDGRSIIVSTESLQSALIGDDGKYTSELAKEIDEQIYFYVPDDMIQDHTLGEYVRSNCV